METNKERGKFPTDHHAKSLLDDLQIHRHFDKKSNIKNKNEKPHIKHKKVPPSAVEFF